MSKKLKFFELFLVFTFFTGQSSCNYAKVTKINCTSSGITTTNLTCKLKPISFKLSGIYLDADFIRPAKVLLVNILLYHKPLLGQTYNQVYNMKNLEVCKWAKIASNPNSIGFMKDFIHYVNLTFAGIVHECPYQGHFKMINATFDYTNSEVAETFKRIQAFPNGSYRLTLRVHNKKDFHIGILKIYYDFYFRENHLNSFDTL